MFACLFVVLILVVLFKCLMFVLVVFAFCDCLDGCLVGGIVLMFVGVSCCFVVFTYLLVWLLCCYLIWFAFDVCLRLERLAVCVVGCYSCWLFVLRLYLCLLIVVALIDTFLFSCFKLMFVYCCPLGLLVLLLVVDDYLVWL